MANDTGNIFFQLVANKVAFCCIASGKAFVARIISYVAGFGDIVREVDTSSTFYNPA